MIDRTIQPLISEPEQLIVPKPEYRIMPNGVPLYIFNAEDHEVVRIDLLIKAGQWRQAKPLQALFTNRMLREGTQHYSSAAIAEKLDYYGAWLDLSTSSEYAYITLYSLNKYLPQTLEILESVVKEPTFPEKELQVIIGNNIQQFLVNQSKVDFLANRALMKALYGDKHPCGHLVEEGDYRSISSELLRDFYTKNYHSENCYIYLSGKVTKKVVCLIEKTFGSEAFGQTESLEARKEYLPVTSSQKRLFVERVDALQSAIRLGMLSVSCLHPDYLKLRVLMTLFGGYFGSRLMSNIREDKGYTYGISAGLHLYPGNSMLVIGAEAANEFVEPLISEVHHEIERLQNDLVSDKELTMVRNYILGDMCRNYESVFSLADAWIFIKTSGLPDTYVKDMWKSTLSITPAEIRKLAEQYLCKESLKEIVSGKKIS
ncbi:MAG: insulinase family protein [Bacteroides sp.]|jgi:predicted Zn-dependent peptidase|nr:insulinase family protein [Bacteroides sp.]MCI1683001.1 insulinase family protein [Bacteroides sp.]